MSTQTSQPQASPTESTRSNLIVVSGVSRVIGPKAARVQILDDINFVVPQLSLFAINGPSGSGKSTLLNLLTGIDHATQGEIVFAGQSILARSENALARQPDIVVVGEAATGEQLLRIAGSARPHVALVDLLMPGIGGIETTRLLRRVHPETQVVVLTSSTALAHVIRALRAGALSYVLKDSTAEQIAIAIRLAAQGKHTLAPAIKHRPAASTSPAHARRGGLLSLTDRELQVLRCIAAGHNNAIIAEQLTSQKAPSKPTSTAS